MTNFSRYRVFMPKPSARSLVVLTVIFIVVALTIWRPDWIARPADEQQAIVESELAKVAFPPNAVLHETQRGARREKAFISRAFDLTVPPNDVQQFFDKQLAVLGWTFTSERPISDWWRDFGGTLREYCKEPYVASLQYAGRNAGYKWDYAFSISWESRQHCSTQR